MLKTVATSFIRQISRNTTNKHLCTIELTRNAQTTGNAATSVANENLSLQAQFANYTEEESEKILNFVNNKDLKELQRYEVSKARVSKLVAWKNRNGPLQQIQDILNIEGFGLKVAHKFYRSLLNETATNKVVEKEQSVRTAPFVIPSIDVEQQQNIRSCVSVRIGVSSVTWSRLELPAQDQNSPCLLTHWQHHEVMDKKLHLHDLVQRCLYVSHLVPAADCYLFENPQMAQTSTNPGNADQQNINIQKAQIIATLSYALCARGRESLNATENSVEPKKQIPSNVFYLRRFLAARLFSHLVGRERVSTEETILKLMRTYYNIDEQQDYLENVDTSSSKQSDCAETSLCQSFRGNVQFPSELRQMFSYAERYPREFLGQALLLNLTFVRLVLLRDADSIAIVTRTAKKDRSPQSG